MYGNNFCSPKSCWYGVCWASYSVLVHTCGKCFILYWSNTMLRWFIGVIIKMWWRQIDARRRDSEKLHLLSNRAASTVSFLWSFGFRLRQARNQELIRLFLHRNFQKQFGYVGVIYCRCTTGCRLLSRGGGPIYYPELHKLCIIAGGPQNQLILS